MYHSLKMIHNSEMTPDKWDDLQINFTVDIIDNKG